MGAEEMNLHGTAQYTPRMSTGQFIATKITPAVIEATREIGEIALLEAQAIVPVDTGELQASGRVVMRTTEKGAGAEIGFTANHAAYVEYGTGILGSISTGAGPYPYDPNWHGMRAQPYLRPALEVARREALGHYALRIRERLGV